MTISQNLFRRHRGARGETNEETRRNESSSTSNNGNGEPSTAAVNNEEETTPAGPSTNSNSTDVENPVDGNSNAISSNDDYFNNDETAENDNEIQELVIRTNLNSSSFTNANNSSNQNNEPTIQFPNWTLNEQEISTRREAIRVEIERMQRANFMHFVVLCLVPTSLLLIVIAAVLTEDGECSGDGLTVCEREPRTFVNAFTTRCICEAVGSAFVDGRGVGEDVDGEAP